MEKTIVEKKIDFISRELSCYYRINELLKGHSERTEITFSSIVKILVLLSDTPETIRVTFVVNDEEYYSGHFHEQGFEYKSNILIDGVVSGYISITTANEIREWENNKRKFLKSITKRIGEYLYDRSMRNPDKYFNSDDSFFHSSGNWKKVIEVFKDADPESFRNLTKKMLIKLSLGGVLDIQDVLVHDKTSSESLLKQIHKKSDILDDLEYGFDVFDLAEENINEKELSLSILNWLQEEHFGILVRTLADSASTLHSIIEGISFFHRLAHTDVTISNSMTQSVLVHLLRRLFSENLDFLQVAREYADIHEFNRLVPNIIYPPNSRGQLGGKAAALFLVCSILKKHYLPSERRTIIRTPKTWHISTDGLYHFLYHNRMEDLSEQKYKDINQIEKEYPLITRLFKRAKFPPELMQGLSSAIDNFGDVPLIVRSSSMLESRVYSGFSWRYKSKILTNKGSKAERLEELMSAIAEVYASTFSPGPIQRRIEEGLIDFNEEMGILIQEVVGRRMGNHFMPIISGTASCDLKDLRYPFEIKEKGNISFICGHFTNYAQYMDLVRHIPLSEMGNATLLDEMTREWKDCIALNINNNVMEKVPVPILRGDACDIYHKDRTFLEDTDDYRNAFQLFESQLHEKQILMDLAFALKILQENMKLPVEVEFATNGVELFILECHQKKYPFNRNTK